MYKIKDFNYKVVLEFGNGREETFKVNGLTDLFQTCKDMASKRGTVMFHAKVYPISQRGHIVTKGMPLLLDTIGTFHYYKKGDRIPFGRI